ncbi:MAG: hypothetical protein ACR2QG_00400, partial [Gammaproteobacteria bacterium]
MKWAAILPALLLIHCGQSPDEAVEVSPTMASAPLPPEVPPPPGLVAEGAVWETLAEGYIYSEGPAADDRGNVYYAEAVYMHLYRIN